MRLQCRLIRVKHPESGRVTNSALMNSRSRACPKRKAKAHAVLGRPFIRRGGVITAIPHVIDTHEFPNTLAPSRRLTGANPYVHLRRQKSAFVAFSRRLLLRLNDLSASAKSLDPNRMI